MVKEGSCNAAESIVNKLKNPTPTESKTINKLFGSTDNNKEPFDPAAESVVNKRHRSKKKRKRN